MSGRRWTALGIACGLPAVALLVGLATMFGERAAAGRSASGLCDYSYVHDDDERAGEQHALVFKARAAGPLRLAGVRAVYRAPKSERWESVELQRIEPGDTWVGVMPAQNAGERRILYFAVSGPSEPGKAPETDTVPPSAPDAAGLFHVTWEGRAPAWLKSLHIGFTVGAGVLLVHAFHCLLVWALGAFAARGDSRDRLRAAWVLSVAAFGAFFVGAIPVGIGVTKAVLDAGYGGWPFGGDVAYTKAEAVLLFWAAVLAWRRDLWRRRGDPRPIADKAFVALWFTGLAVAAAALLVPSSLFLVE